MFSVIPKYGPLGWEPRCYARKGLGVRVSSVVVSAVDVSWSTGEGRKGSVVEMFPRSTVSSSTFRPSVEVHIKKVGN